MAMRRAPQGLVVVAVLAAVLALSVTVLLHSISEPGVFVAVFVPLWLVGSMSFLGRLLTVRAAVLVWTGVAAGLAVALLAAGTPSEDEKALEMASAVIPLWGFGLVAVGMSRRSDRATAFWIWTALALVAAAISGLVAPVCDYPPCTQSEEATGGAVWWVTLVVGPLWTVGVLSIWFVTRRRPAERGGDKRAVTEHANIGRNDPCWCGSGRKFRKCHGA